jgi:MFS family permease
MFVLLGAPGLPLAALAWFTLREPRIARASTGVQSQKAAAQADSPSLRDVCSTLWGNATFRHLLLCLAVLFFFNNGIGLWLPTFFVRSHGMTSGEIGSGLALAWGLGGLAGGYLGGALPARYAAHNERLQLRAVAITVAASGAAMVPVFVASDPYAAIAFTGLVSIGVNAVNGPLFATMQTLVSERMRAVSLAFVYLFANLIGMGLGPLATGRLSDMLQPQFGAESLRYALLCLCPGFWWVAWHAWRAGSTVDSDLALGGLGDGDFQRAALLAGAPRNP